MHDQNKNNYSNYFQVAVIGAGLGGLATACRLAKLGYKVLIYEKNPDYGGKVGLINLDLTNHEQKKISIGFDAGPSLITMIYVYQELFKDCGYVLEDFLEYKKLDNICNYFWLNSNNTQQQINLKGGLDEQVDLLSKNFQVSRQKILNYYLDCQRVFKLVAPVFLYNQFSFRTLFNPVFWKGVFNYNLLAPLQSLHQFNQNKLKHPKLVQLFDRFATFNGSNPYQTSSIMRVISYVENGDEPGFGVYTTKNGVRSIADSIYQLALKLGVRFAFNTSVDKIIYQNQKVIGIQAEDRFYSHQIVVSNQDYFMTQKYLLDRKIDLPKKALSSSAIIFYWAVKTDTQKFSLHNIFFSADYQQEFKQIFEQHQIPTDPTIYLNIGCKDGFTKQTSPDNYQNWFIMINVPAEIDEDWQIIQSLKQKIIEKISVFADFDLEKAIVAEKIRLPKDISQEFFSYSGALYGKNSNSLLSAFLRPGIKDKKIKNLYYVGGSVHPGGGMPLVVLGSKMVAQEIKNSRVIPN